MYCGSNVFFDAASHVIYVHHQPTLSAADTILGKTAFERFAMDHGVSIKNYHSDNGVYTAKEYMKELASKGQGIKHSGVGAKWQNSYGENAVKLVVTRARAMMLHASLHWPEEYEEQLWPLAVSYAAYL